MSNYTSGSKIVQRQTRLMDRQSECLLFRLTLPLRVSQK